MKLEEVKRLYLHCEIIQPDPDDNTFTGKATASTDIPMDRRKLALSAAFLASQRAVKNFKPVVTNDDVDAALKTDLGNVDEAHQIAFTASQVAVEDFDFDELILPL